MKRWSLVVGLTVVGCGDGGSSWESACFRVCDAQKEGCPTLDLQGCHELCAYAVTVTKEKAGCLEKLEALWTCEAEQAWSCDPQTDIVGMLIDPAGCEEERGEYEDAGCDGQAAMIERLRTH